MNRPIPTTATTTVVVVVAVIIIIILYYYIILYCLYYIVIIYGFPKHHKPKDAQNLHKNACKEKEILSLRERPATLRRKLFCAACMCNRAATTHLVFRIIRLQKILDTK